jgi:predicted DNA-binding transcriptional regulator YafY
VAVDRVERLTNLLALLLETREPLSLVQIAGALEGQYPDAIAARRAAFERDKAALREIGVPIETEVLAGGPYAGQTRYRIHRRAYELADLDLAPDEMRALQVAVATVHTGSGVGQDAIWKLGGELGEDRPAVTAMVPDRPELPVIRDAVAARAPITFSYRGEERRLDPWGLLLRGGFWYVVGHDHDRDAQRTFRVDRMDGGATAIVVGPPGSFQRPGTFDPRNAFPADPKQIGHSAADGVEAIIRIDAGRAGAVERELGADRVVERSADGIVVRVPASNLPALRSWVLGLLEHAVVLEPPEVRTHIVEWVRAVAGSATGTPT